MPTNKHNLLLHRTFQYTTIVLIMAAMGGGYWYWKNAQAGLNINTSQEGTLSNGLVGYWPFDGNDISGTTVYDRSGQGNNGTLTNGPTKAMGKVGQALSFDGSDDYIDVPDSAALSLTGDMTISAWVNPSNLANIHGIIGKTYSNVPGPYDYYIDTDTGGGCGGTGPNKRAFYRGNGGIYAYVCSKSAIVANKWQHVAVTMSGTTVTHYLDGVPDGSGTLSTTIADSNTTLRIGSRNDNYTKMFGSLDEPRIYNRALSASEIWDLYQMGAADKVNSAESQGDSLEKGMVGYWKLDDGSGTSAADASGNANTGTLTGSPAWVSGKVGGGLSLNGTSQYVSVNDETKLNPSVVSVSAWAYRLTDVSTWPVIVHKEVYSTSKGYVLGPLGNGEPVGFRINGDNVYVPKESSSSYNQWVHYVGIFDGNKMYLYKNGVLQETVDPAFTSISSSTQNLGIGLDLSGSSTYWHGSIDEVRVYNRVLTADEVAKLYKTTAPDNPDTGLVGYWPFNGKDISGTTAYDRSGKGNTGTLTNSPTNTIGSVGQALSFDGTNDEVTTTTNYGDSSSLKIVSVAAWFKTSTASGKKVIGLEQVQSGYNNNKDRGIYVGTDGKVYFAVYDGGVKSAVSSGTYTDGNWHHAVGVSSGDGTNIKLYVDGVLQQTTSIGTIQTYAGGTSYWRIGGYSNDGFTNASNGYFPGQIDEVRVYNRALSASEIWGLYQAGAADKVNSADSQSAPLERGLAGYWRFDDASGGSATDSSGNGMTGTLTNGPTWTTGQVDGAVDLDGTNDYVSIADNAALDIGTGDFTYGFWLNPDVATQGVFFSDGSYSDGIMFYRYTDNYTYLWLANTYIQTTAWGPTASTWQHVTVRRKSGTVAIYADGVQKYTTGSLTGSINSSSGMRIGYGFAGAANLVLDGRIDEFRMYNRALSDEEIIQLSRLGRPDDPDTGLVGYWPFNGPDIVGTTAYDRSSRGNNGTLTNGPTRAIGKIGQGISFDGTDDYVTMGNAADIGASDASISVWIKLPNSNQAGYIVGKRRDGPSYEQYAVTAGYVNSGGSFVSNKKIGLFFTNDGGLNTTNTQSYYTTNDVADGNWHHAVVVRQNGTTPKIYIDGISMSLTAVFANTNNVNTSNSSALVVGSSGAGSFYATGILDEPRIYNRALTQAEIIALYRSGR